MLCANLEVVLNLKGIRDTTLELPINDVKSMAILDTGVGVSIVAKEIWKNLGKLALCRTRMGMQLADGETKYPMVLLEDVKVAICGIRIEHTFAIGNYEQNPNYEVILGRSLMRQMLVV